VRRSAAAPTRTARAEPPQTAESSMRPGGLPPEQAAPRMRRKNSLGGSGKRMSRETSRTRLPAASLDSRAARSNGGLPSIVPPPERRASSSVSNCSAKDIAFEAPAGAPCRTQLDDPWWRARQAQVGEHTVDPAERRTAEQQSASLRKRPKQKQKGKNAFNRRNSSVGAVGCPRGPFSPPALRGPMNIALARRRRSPNERGQVPVSGISVPLPRA